jgi:hypothetical protein
MTSQQGNEEMGDTNVAHGWHSLPAELRLKIYRLSWEPRAVCVDRIGVLDKEGLRCLKPKRKWDWDAIKLRVGSSTRPPTTLHLSFEVRAETLRHYVPFFRGYDEKGKPQVLYFNPSVDVLFLSFYPDIHATHPLRSRDAAKFWNLVSVAHTVYFTGPWDRFPILLEDVRSLVAEVPGRGGGCRPASRLSPTLRWRSEG